MNPRKKFIVTGGSSRKTDTGLDSGFGIKPRFRDLITDMRFAKNDTERKKILAEATGRYGLGRMKSALAYCMSHDTDLLIGPIWTAVEDGDFAGKFLPGYNLSSGILDAMLDGMHREYPVAMIAEWLKSSPEPGEWAALRGKCLQKCRTSGEILDLFSGGGFFDGLIRKYFEHHLNRLITHERLLAAKAAGESAKTRNVPHGTGEKK